MARGIEIKLEGGDDLRRYLAAMPRETESVLRSSVNRAVKAAHNEALIQISRTYTISMQGVERDLKEFTAKGGSIVAKLIGRGRPRGALNFDISPSEATPKRAWTSKSGYRAQILRGVSKTVSRDYFWIELKGGNVHLARRQDPSARDKDSNKDLHVFRTVSTPQMLGNKDVAEKVSEVTKATLEDVFAKGMERRLLKGAMS